MLTEQNAKPFCKSTSPVSLCSSSLFCSVYIWAFLRCLFGFKAFQQSVSSVKNKGNIAISIHYVTVLNQHTHKHVCVTGKSALFCLVSCPAHSLPFANQRCPPRPLLRSQLPQPLHSPASLTGSKYLMSF